MSVVSETESVLLHASAHRHKQAGALLEGSAQPGRRERPPRGHRGAKQVKGAAVRLQGGFQKYKKQNTATCSCESQL